MSCPTTIIPISTSMDFGRIPTLSRSALTVTDSSSLATQLPLMTNGNIKPASSKSCQTSNTYQTRAPSYSYRRSLAKVMPSLSKKNDTSQQQRNHVADSSPKKANNRQRQISSINTNPPSASVTTNNKSNGLPRQKQQQQQPCSTEHAVSTPSRQNQPAPARRSSLRKTSPRPLSYHATTGNDEETGSTRSNNKHGSVLNPTVPSAESAAATTTVSSAVPASAQKQKQKQQQRRLSRGGTSSSSSPQLALPQHRRLSSPPSAAGIVKQNKTETLASPTSPTKLQNAKKTPLGAHPAGTVTSDSSSDGDDAVATMDNQQQYHVKQQQQQQQQHRAQHSRRANHLRHQTLQPQNDPLLLHQRRTSIASLSPLPRPNGVSSSSSSTLVRRRSLADISPRSSLAPSASTALPQHHHHHHHHQQQNDQENKLQQQTMRPSQSHLRHPSWLDSAGFMRPSKCSICHPPPPKKSVITPPAGMGVPKFGLPPPDTTTTPTSTVIATTTITASMGATASTTSKHGLERRSSSRNSLVYEKLGKHGQPFGLSSSSMALADNSRSKNTVSYIDGMARMDQRRRLSLPNPMDNSRPSTKKLAMEKRSSFYNSNSSSSNNKGTVTGAVDHSTTHRFSSNKRVVAPRTKKTGKQLASPDTPVLDKDFTHSPSSSSSLNEASMDTTSSSSSNPSPTTADESRPSTPIDIKHQTNQLMASDYLKPLDDGNDDGYSDETHNLLNEPGLLRLEPSPLPLVTNDDVAECGGGGDQQHNRGALEQLQAFLDSTATEAAAEEKHRQPDFEIPPVSLMSEDTSDAAQCTSSSSSSSSLSDMSLHLQDSSSNDTTTKMVLQQQPPSTSVLSDLEQWTEMVRLTLGRWFTDLNHGHLEHYEKDADGSITTMTITGYVITMEPDLIHQPSSSTLTDEKRIQQHRYTLCLGQEERQHTFSAMASSSSDCWTPDDQVDRCQFKNKNTSVPCDCEFDWMNRRHHCRSCGDIFCKTHSSNRLPLFTKKQPNQIKWSRVCDSCCYDLVGTSLVKL
ncbi:unnamed protein product [Absidia cylindrospora]